MSLCLQNKKAPEKVNSFSKDREIQRMDFLCHKPLETHTIGTERVILGYDHQGNEKLR